MYSDELRVRSNIQSFIFAEEKSLIDDRLSTL